MNAIDPNMSATRSKSCCCTRGPIHALNGSVEQQVTRLDDTPTRRSESAATRSDERLARPTGSRSAGCDRLKN